MISVHHNLPHWNFYRLLEDDLEQCCRFVSPAPEHYEVYSDEFARIILLAAVEVENILREFAAETACVPAPNKIGEFCDCVTNVFPKMRDAGVVMPRYSVGALKPWDGWSSSLGPDWWSQGYNKIKHDRIGNPKSPTMLRAIAAVGALLVLLLYYYRKRFGKECCMPVEIAPRLLMLEETDDGWTTMGMGYIWKLPDD